MYDFLGVLYLYLQGHSTITVWHFSNVEDDENGKLGDIICTFFSISLSYVGKGFKISKQGGTKQFQAPLITISFHLQYYHHIYMCVQCVSFYIFPPLSLRN